MIEKWYVLWINVSVAYFSGIRVVPLCQDCSFRSFPFISRGTLLMKNIYKLKMAKVLDVGFLTSKLAFFAFLLNSVISKGTVPNETITTYLLKYFLRNVILINQAAGTNLLLP